MGTLRARRSLRPTGNPDEPPAFAEKLPKTAAELYVHDASDDDLAAEDKLVKSSIHTDLLRT
ncbi:hypothetical protein ACIRNI_28655 [Streptomyces sp. NPDC093546]|uniref:hypothetical protein n=1 Tax=Streptomyces sp. NPDC093546 TaxID=3366040 RepID=UPI003818ABD0